MGRNVVRRQQLLQHGGSHEALRAVENGTQYELRSSELNRAMSGEDINVENKRNTEEHTRPRNILEIIGHGTWSSRSGLNVVDSTKREHAEGQQRPHRFSCG